MSGPPSHSRGEDAGEYFLELMVDALQQLEPAVQAAFLKGFLKSLASVEVSESDSLGHWEGILRRRREMNERLGRPVTVGTAAADYFRTVELLQSPVLVEYEELKRLRHSAATDPLTGLYNRRLFEEYMARELVRSRRYSSSLVLLLFDLRNFKQANDTYGHSTGDEILRSLARACVETIRGSDYAFRIGGDEFALLLPESGSQSAHGLAQRITQKFEQYAHALAPDAKLGLDYGVAAFPEDGESADKLFEAADRNVYTHKGKMPRGSVESLAELERSRPLAELRQNSATGNEPKKQQRRHERISLEGAGAHGVLYDGFVIREVQVLDLGLGGVSFLLDEATKLPDIFHARLHMSLFHSEELTVRRVYIHTLPQGSLRVGCSFVP